MNACSESIMIFSPNGVSQAPPTVGGVELDQVEFHAQADNQGNVSNASFIGAQVNVQGGIYFVLRRRRE